MRFFVTCDADIESGLNEVLNKLNNDGLDNYFEDRFYDDSGINITVVLMCRDSRWNFKQRIRFSKKENKLYMDIMLDLNVMKHLNPAARRKLVAEKLVTEVPQVFAKYKFKDFDLKRFSSDLRSWFVDQGWVDQVKVNDDLL